MESNWRYDVWRLGLGIDPVRLIAPSHEVTGWWLTDRKHATLPWYAYYYDAGGSQGYVQTGAYAIPHLGHPNFPYGHAVGPDHT